MQVKSVEVINNPTGIYVRIQYGECNQMDILIAEQGTSMAINAEQNAPDRLRAGAKYYRAQAAATIELAGWYEKAADALEAERAKPVPTCEDCGVVTEYYQGTAVLCTRCTSMASNNPMETDYPRYVDGPGGD